MHGTGRCTEEVASSDGSTAGTWRSADVGSGARWVQVFTETSRFGEVISGFRFVFVRVGVGKYHYGAKTIDGKRRRLREVTSGSCDKQLLCREGALSEENACAYVHVISILSLYPILQNLLLLLQRQLLCRFLNYFLCNYYFVPA